MRMYRSSEKVIDTWKEKEFASHEELFALLKTSEARIENLSLQIKSLRNMLDDVSSAIEGLQEVVSNG